MAGPEHPGRPGHAEPVRVTALAPEVVVVRGASLADVRRWLSHPDVERRVTYQSHLAAHGISAPVEDYGLSRQETAILVGIAAGMGNKDIAVELMLSANTVKTYIRSLYAKIGVQSRSQAVLWTVRNDFPGRLPEEG